MVYRTFGSFAEKITESYDKNAPEPKKSTLKMCQRKYRKQVPVNHILHKSVTFSLI